MKSIEDAVRFRYLNIRSDRSRAILKIQHVLIGALREFLTAQGFYQVLAPVVGPVTDPGIRGAGIAHFDFYGTSYTIMSSMILYKQMALGAFENVFSLSPNVRLEEASTVDTGRHLAEFYQLDLESARKSCQDMMDLGDRMVCYCMDAIRECPEELAVLGRELPSFSPPFRRIPHRTLEETLSIPGEIPFEEEHDLSESSSEPFWVYDYPVGSRGFYYLERDGVLKSMDLIMPEGFGEVISGGEREYRYQEVKALLDREGVADGYSWYLDMLKAGIPPSAGFGLGIERFTRYICGLDHIWESSPFPKVPGIP
jgi:asparaginyl-tRNA synthetase